MKLQGNAMSSEQKITQPNILLHMANMFFHLVHLTIVTFFLFGWLSSRTLMAHFLLSILILVSWCGLGIIYGFGYCLVTDIQWRIKRRMGEVPYTEYYMKYMLDKVTGRDLNAHKLNSITTYAFFIILLLSTALVLRRML